MTATKFCHKSSGSISTHPGSGYIRVTYKNKNARSRVASFTREYRVKNHCTRRTRQRSH
uniref:Uncharacterized protein n=1 Tax=Anguilla anguilla TaxID=7936 RepID=A0A0E9QPT0_ANGAN